MNTLTYFKGDLSGTSVRLQHLELNEINGRVFSGKLVLSTSDSKTERHDWRAEYMGNGRWNLIGDGAVLKSGTRVPNIAEAPFSLSPMVNYQLGVIIKNALNNFRAAENKGTTGATVPAKETEARALAPVEPPSDNHPPEQPAPPTPPPPPPPAPIPPPVPKTEDSEKGKKEDEEKDAKNQSPTDPNQHDSNTAKPKKKKAKIMKTENNTTLIEAVVAKACEIHHIANLNELKKGTKWKESRARQEISYVLYVLRNQSTEASWEAIGAHGRANVYFNIKQVKKRLADNDAETKANIGTLNTEAERFQDSESQSRKGASSAKNRKATKRLPKVSGQFRQSGRAAGESGQAIPTNRAWNMALVCIFWSMGRRNAVKIAAALEINEDDVYTAIGRAMVKLDGQALEITKFIQGLAEKLA